MRADTAKIVSLATGALVQGVRTGECEASVAEVSSYLSDLVRPHFAGRLGDPAERDRFCAVAQAAFAGAAREIGLGEGPSGREG